ncbi:MAG: hypothetical protein ACOYK8_07660 [Alphaproteobacteria bacterium]
MLEASEFQLLEIDQAIEIVEKAKNTTLHAGGFAAFLYQFLKNKPDDYAFSVEEAKLLRKVIDNLAPVPAVSAAVDAALLPLVGVSEAAITLAQSSGAYLDSIQVKPTIDAAEKAVDITAPVVGKIQQLFNIEAAAVVVTPCELPAVTVQNLELVQEFVCGAWADNLKNILHNLSQPAVRIIDLGLGGMVPFSMNKIRKKLQELKDMGLLDNEQNVLATGLLNTDIIPEQITIKQGLRPSGLG